MARASSSKARKQRHDPLLKDLDAAQGTLKKINRKKLAQSEATNTEDLKNEDGYIDSKASRKILQLAKEQQDEIEGEELVESERNKQLEARFTTMSYNDEEEEDDEEEDEFGEDISDFEPEGDFKEEEEVVEIDEEDAAMFEQYFKNSNDFNSLSGSYNLADKIMASIREKENQFEGTQDDEPIIEEQNISRGNLSSV